MLQAASFNVGDHCPESHAYEADDGVNINHVTPKIIIIDLLTPFFFLLQLTTN